MFYYVRHPDPEMVEQLFERVAATAEGAARGTGTEMRFELIHGILALLPNETLQRVMHQNLLAVGGVNYTAEERAFSRRLQSSFGQNDLSLDSASEVSSYQSEQPPGGSTDVGDVSWVVPTARLRTATGCPTPTHSWQGSLPAE